MVRSVCINKVRDKNNIIIGYNLTDRTGKTAYIDAKNVKSAIASGKIAVDNLKLTSDGRLISVNPDNTNDNKDRSEINIKTEAEEKPVDKFLSKDQLKEQKIWQRTQQSY